PAKPNATPAARPAPPVRPDSARADTARKVDSTGTPVLVREQFSYEGGGRDPFLSLLRSGDIRPLLSDLRLVGIYYDGRYPAVSVRTADRSVEVVIDLQGAEDVQDFTLASPARLVVDLQGARLVAPAVLYDGLNRGGIKNIRYAQFRPGVVRIVIDVDVLKDYRIERKDGQMRVRIGTERTAFAAWSSQAAARDVPTAPPSRSAERASGGQAAARVAAPAPSDQTLSIDEYLSEHAKESEQSQAARITVTWDNADLREVVAGFAAFSGRTIILSKDIKGQVSAEIKNQPWDLAFNA